MEAGVASVGLGDRVAIGEAALVGQAALVASAEEPVAEEEVRATGRLLDGREWTIVDCQKRISCREKTGGRGSRLTVRRKSRITRMEYPDHVFTGRPSSLTNAKWKRP